MIKLLFVIIVVLIILFILWKKNKDLNLESKSKFYRNLLIIIFIFGILFFLATSGKVIIPQILSLFKIFLPLLTKLIGI